MKSLIDGRNMQTREDAHAELKRALALPEYYGANLDALWDLATTMRADAELTHATDMLNALKGYGCKLLTTLYEAADENPEFQFALCTDDAQEPESEWL
ncbi:MAG: barstar family protein [Clostridia bacterium]|nr:barstar family protein [Clostridia bacterium]